MFVPVPDVVTCELIHSLFDRPCEVTLHFRFRDPPMSEVNQAIIGSRVGFWWSTYVLPHLSWDLQFLYVRTTDQSVPAGFVTSDSTYAGAGGTVRNAMPASVAAVIQLWTGIQTGVTRNRNYIPGLPDTSVIGNRLHPEWWPSIVEGYNALIDQAPIANFWWVGVHRFEGHTPLLEGTSSRVIHAKFLRYTVGQRRRRLHNSFDP